MSEMTLAKALSAMDHAAKLFANDEDPIGYSEMIRAREFVSKISPPLKGSDAAYERILAYGDDLAARDSRAVLSRWEQEYKVLMSRRPAALAHPRPTGDAKVLTTQAILDRIESVSRQADAAMHSNDEKHLRNTLEIIADDLTAIIAAERVHAPRVSRLGRWVV